MNIVYERELTSGRSTLRATVWRDDRGKLHGMIQMEPSEGRLHVISMDVDPAILQEIEGVAGDAATAMASSEGQAA
jgi:hypothetical protein